MWIDKNHTEMERVVARKFCVEDTSFSDYVKLYNDYLDAEDVDFDQKVYITDTVLRYRKNSVSDSRYVLWKQNEVLRYYDIDSRDYTELLETLNLDIYENVEYSTVKFMNDYPDVILSCTTGYVWNKLFRKEFLLEKEVVFDVDLRVFEDTHFVVTALSLADKVAKCHERLIHHRVYTNQPRNKLFKRYYNQVPVVYSKIKEFLRAHGMYTPLSQSFLNLSASRCYKIYNLLWNDAKSEFWDMLHEQYAEEFCWDKAQPEEFESEDVCNFVAAVLIYNHKQQEKRERKGLKIRIKSVGKAIKAVQLRKKTKEFFAKLFGKGNKKEEV
jgi:hypothetical protein